MPTQKQFSADPANPIEVEGLLALAKDLVMDGWGATVSASPQHAHMTTNAPMNIINFHLRKHADVSQ
jgi:hypothetical protein